MQISQVTTPEQIATVRSLFQEYAERLGIPLCFQGFAAEVAGLPGSYAFPRGRLFLAAEMDQAAGCAALRPAGDAVCEMKRLFVRPAYRGRGLGRELVERVISEARAIGYSTMVLDTLPVMKSAIQLYESVGFVRRPAYYQTPLPDTVFMELQLGTQLGRG